MYISLVFISILSNHIKLHLDRIEGVSLGSAERAVDFWCHGVQLLSALLGRPVTGLANLVLSRAFHDMKIEL